ncbi:MAG: hypothetical protein DI564_12180 [Rhodanobacter denitrificans]|uniref:DUF3618 domain-containing protein n=1 Tax=Rhodanobacter denitrificans TaxID=666685 RepID=A0A2W5K6K9_9GAMM|nr:MAG: hypothetical protein DI564_12180 [Rhodanobacter denitrificans]
MRPETFQTRINGATPEPPPADTPTLRYPGRPVFGDVIDALDDAAASLRVVVGDTGESLLKRTASLVRDRPVATLATVAAAAFLLGRLRR